jgi:putative flavoprotein involved in K+ transport
MAHPAAVTGPFQRGVIPPLVPPDPGITQMHSTAYRNPDRSPPGAVLVIGAGSSGTQIADELSRAGRRVYLRVGRPSSTWGVRQDKLI